MDVERTQARLENAQTVEPILGALRTISLGTWQAAASRLIGLKEITREYYEIMGSLAPVLESPSEKNRKKRQSNLEKNAISNKKVVLLVGTERGLCGRLDQDLIAYVEEVYPDGLQPAEIELFVVGGRLGKAVRKQLMQPDTILSSSSTALPNYPEVFELTKNWIRRIGSGELSCVEVIFQAFHGATHHEPVRMQLLPYELKIDDTQEQEKWPPPIIETDAAQLFMRVYEQLAALRLYDALLQAKASIHAARYQLMEDSTRNAERLIEDLTVILQTERRQNITREMQELAIGAGLLQE